ncbi:hypothetical protein [Paenibacillus zanthoxyli]|uniref:hypothetical protein n=1 Tax=Paenibacillus zanthoxyli TaxID=369399 RepID=UPI000471DF21|nr:hypothetical protein [Paenibacillus zanthoxyli]
MNKLTLGIATLLLSTTFLAACGNQEPTNANNPAPTTSSNTTESNTSGTDSTTGTDNNSTLSSSNNIKWDEIKDPLIDEAMKDKLKASVDAIVNKDVVTFHKTLGPNVGTVHDYLLDNPVKFTDVGEAHEEDGRILVPVKGENQSSDGNTSEMGYTFYFEKDKSGEWQIVSID